jgi:quercetin dioxygenase-like cupin family protein
MNIKDLIGQTLIADADLDWTLVEDGIKRKIMAYDDHLMLVKVAFEKGRIGAMHHHKHLQISYIASGVFEITIAENVKILRGGDVYFVPENAVHGARCLEDGVLVDVFSPMREDFLI